VEISQQGHVIITCQLEPGDLVKCRLPEQQIKVYFDGININVKMQTPLFMGRQCGVCGNMDFDPNSETEFYKLDSETDWYEPELNTRKALHSYTIKDAQCSRPENPEEMCDDERCSFRQTPFPNEFSRLRKPYNLPKEFDFRPDVKPIRKTLQIERDGKSCFSKRPVPICPENSYATETVKAESLKFDCKSKHSSYWGDYDDSSSQETGGSQFETQARSESPTQQPSGHKTNTGSRRHGNANSNSAERRRHYNRLFTDSDETETEITATIRLPKSCRRF